MIACIDGLKGFPDAIKSVFPDTAVQFCVIHQIRNSMKYVGSKYQKEFMKDLKPVYGAVTKVTKNKGIFPNDTALVKLVYLAYRNAHKKWTMSVPNWGIISQQLAIKFEDRYNLL